MLNYQVGACTTGEDKDRHAVTLEAIACCLPPHHNRVIQPNSRKIVAISNSSFPRTYTLFGKISGSFNRIMSIFEPINRPY
ncbi:MAG: hypothetical protein V7K55_07520 [Nostoc sp.]|uniref:hypothetical protein n=1 Tax=Nostoc sp. TaxID=1180 RepID=UPI002FFBA897